MRKNQKIGLFGGTFDPVHNGHLIIAEYLRDELQLDEIWFIPTGKHPLKDNRQISSVEHRLNMLRLAIADNERFKISEIEIHRPGVSYTIDTLNELLETYRDREPKFYYFIGMDNVNELHKWREPEKIVEKCQVVAFGRPGFQPQLEAQPFVARIQFVHVPLLEISSTFVRQRIREGRSVRYIVPKEVEQYILRHALYRRDDK